MRLLLTLAQVTIDFHLFLFTYPILYLIHHLIRVLMTKFLKLMALLYHFYLYIDFLDLDDPGLFFKYPFIFFCFRALHPIFSPGMT